VKARKGAKAQRQLTQYKSIWEKEYNVSLDK